MLIGAKGFNGGAAGSAPVYIKIVVSFRNLASGSRSRTARSAVGRCSCAYACRSISISFGVFFGIILSKSTNEFTLDFFNQVSSKVGASEADSKNIFLSPFNVFSALSMLLIGLDGTSRDQLIHALHLDSESKVGLNTKLADAMKGARSSTEGAVISTAAAAWLHQNLAVLDKYTELLKIQFESEATTIDFAQTQAATKRINDWVMSKTNGMIKDLIGPNVIDALTRLILVSAIHFKGQWHSQFKKSDTESGAPFHLIGAAGLKASVKMMTQKASFRMGDVGGDLARGLVLPYSGKQISMIIILPNENNGSIHQIAQNSPLLLQAVADAHSGKWAESQVLVKLPRFSIEYGLDCVDVMRGMGATDLFDENKLDLTNMINPGRGHLLYVSNIIHKAVVDVNEEGTEAAAATAVVMKARGRAPPVPLFIVDRPFLFLICNGPQILFIGKYMSP